MKVIVDHIILAYAFRYALGRRTSSAHDVSEAIIENLDKIPKYILEIMNGEIREAAAEGMLGDNCDEQAWKELSIAIEEKLSPIRLSEKVCVWTKLRSAQAHLSTCGLLLHTTEGTLKEKDLNHCPKCGNKIQEA